MSRDHHRQQIKDYLSRQFNLPADQVEMMVPVFIKTLSEHMENIEIAVKSGDLDLLGKAAHTIKGALLNLGLHESADIAMDIEQSGKADDQGTDYEALVLCLRKQLDHYFA